MTNPFFMSNLEAEAINQENKYFLNIPFCANGSIHMSIRTSPNCCIWYVCSIHWQIIRVTSWWARSLIANVIFGIRSRTTTIHRTCSSPCSCSIIAWNRTTGPIAPLSPRSYWWTSLCITDLSFLWLARTSEDQTLRSSIQTCAIAFTWTASTRNSTTRPACPSAPS